MNLWLPKQILHLVSLKILYPLSSKRLLKGTFFFGTPPLVGIYVIHLLALYRLLCPSSLQHETQQLTMTKTRTKLHKIVRAISIKKLKDFPNWSRWPWVKYFVQELVLRLIDSIQLLPFLLQLLSLSSWGYAKKHEMQNKYFSKGIRLFDFILTYLNFR